MHFFIVESSDFLPLSLGVECIMSSFSASVVLILVLIFVLCFSFLSAQSIVEVYNRYLNGSFMNSNEKRMNNTHSSKFIIVHGGFL